ncbi:hypothetical protein K503DRAFT_859607 [Rhizopogon vinicolor AM-OR11-026]|uniref:Uncharacterized protein n=1 Tax=Rhizopogon vinicolor AM-OR11-026 TaxID=1314800 RepID=A0A1B7MME4_9AGAM|nr:hypothetical protein K503DRAFT_859607 [Rhizopogon vinicolor AM-OR11-026]
MHMSNISGKSRATSLPLRCLASTPRMTLLYKLKSGESKTIRVPFDPLLSKYEDVKPRLLGMKAEAQEGLGMLKTPQLATFRLPPLALASALVSLTYFYLFSPPSPGPTFLDIPVGAMDAFFSPAHAFRSATGFGLSFRTACTILGTVHAAETLYTWSLCRHFVKSTLATAAYVGGTFIFGMPIWIDLKRRVQEKRIESVMKATSGSVWWWSSNRIDVQAVDEFLELLNSSLGNVCQHHWTSQSKTGEKYCMEQ